MSHLEPDIDYRVDITTIFPHTISTQLIGKYVFPFKHHTRYTITLDSITVEPRKLYTSQFETNRSHGTNVSIHKQNLNVYYRRIMVTANNYVATKTPQLCRTFSDI